MKLKCSKIFAGKAGRRKKAKRLPVFPAITTPVKKIML